MVTSNAWSKFLKRWASVPAARSVLGMEGLIAEGSEVMEDDFEGDVKDAALISAAQRVEHYEIAAYGTLCAFADLLGESEHASLLRETLEEEKQTDEKLSDLSDEINAAANQPGSEGSDQRPGRRKPGQAA